MPAALARARVRRARLSAHQGRAQARPESALGAARALPRARPARARDGSPAVQGARQPHADRDRGAPARRRSPSSPRSRASPSCCCGGSGATCSRAVRDGREDEHGPLPKLAAERPAPHGSARRPAPARAQALARRARAASSRSTRACCVPNSALEAIAWRAPETRRATSRGCPSSRAGSCASSRTRWWRRARGAERRAARRGAQRRRPETTRPSGGPSSRRGVLIWTWLLPGKGGVPFWGNRLWYTRECLSSGLDRTVRARFRPIGPHQTNPISCTLG